MRAKFMATLFLPVLLSACAMDEGQNSIDETPSMQRQDRKILPNEGRWLARQSLRGINSAEHFVFTGEYLSEESATLTLHTHFNGFAARDGAQLTLMRAGTALRIRLQTPGTQPKESLLEDQFSESGMFRYRVEIHDGISSGVRVLIWRDWQNLNGEFVTARTTVSAATADWDSQQENWFFDSHGRGALWGYELKNVRMTSVRREAPYVP